MYIIVQLHITSITLTLTVLTASVECIKDKYRQYVEREWIIRKQRRKLIIKWYGDYETLFILSHILDETQTMITELMSFSFIAIFSDSFVTVVIMELSFWSFYLHLLLLETFAIHIEIYSSEDNCDLTFTSDILVSELTIITLNIVASAESVSQLD